MLRIGLVGCGFMGRMHANVYSLLDGAELAAIYDHRPAKAEAFGSEYSVPVVDSLEKLIGLSDAVDICLPTDLHAGTAIAALNAGRHVFCEKPMARSLDEADAMIEAWHRSGKALMIGHCIRFWPEYALLKEIVDDRRYGKLLSLNLTRYGEFPSWSSDGWLGDETRSGGGVLDMHIHDTDFAHYLLGEPDAVVTHGTYDRTGASHAFTTMRFGDAVAHLEGGWNLPPGAPFKMAFRAVFEHGAAIFDGGPMTLYAPGVGPIVPEFPVMKAEGGGNISDLGGYYHELKYFVDRVSAGLPLETVTPESSRRSLATALAEVAAIKAQSS